MPNYSQIKQIDSGAAADGDVGSALLAVRQDAISPLEADGKYGPLYKDANGHLRSVVQSTTLGGATPYTYIATAAADQDAQVVKASPGTLYSVIVTSVNAAVRYLKIYDKASAPSSADTPVMILMIPGSTTGGGVTVPIPACGLAFAAGIAIRLTTGVANNNASAVTTQEHVVSMIYK